jgi:hypothetical protein
MDVDFPHHNTLVLMPAHWHGSSNCIDFLEILGPFPAKTQEVRFSPRYSGLKSFGDGMFDISRATNSCHIILSL